MIRQGLVAVVLLVAAGCTTVPYKVPLSADARAKVESAAVQARANDKGIGVQYMAQDSTAAGAPYGLIGALVSATIDAIANARPAHIAENSAGKLAAGYNTDEMQSELALALSTELRNASLPGATATVAKMGPNQKLTAKDFSADNVLAVNVNYALTQDYRSLRVVADAVLFSKSAAPKTPPKGAEPGTVYRNHFEFWSAPLDAPPAKSQAEIDAAVAAVEAKYANAGKDQDAAKKAELDDARNPNAQRAQADYMVKQWLADNGSRLHAAIRSGTGEIASLLALDLADPTNVDVKAKLPASTVVREANGRQVTRLNIGLTIGSLESRPVGYNAPLANALAYRSEPKPSGEKTASIDQ
jgi:hypothetical protein